jgi:hypothetical protein
MINWKSIGAVLLGVGLCGIGYQIRGLSGVGYGLAIAVGFVILINEIGEK